MRINGQWVLKPPVLPRRTIRAMALLVVCAVWYGTMIPFGPVGGPSPPASDPSGAGALACHISFNADALANLIVYVPVGLFLRLALRRRPARPVLEIIVVTLAAAALSLFTEALQAARPQRTADLGDACFNAAGALLGALCATPFQELLRRIHAAVLYGMHESPLLFMTLGAGAAMAASQLSIVLRDEGLARLGTAAPAIAPIEVLTRWCGLAVFGFLAILAASRDPRATVTAAAVRVFGALAAAVVFEGMLAMSPLCRVGSQDLLAALAVAVIGATAAVLVWRLRPDEGPPVVTPADPGRMLPSGLLLVLALMLLTLGLAPFCTLRTTHGPAGWAWLPLQSEFPRAWLLWLSDGIVALVRFAIAAYLLAAVIARWSRRATAPRVALLAFAGCAASQFAYLRWTGRWADSIALVLVLLASVWAARTYNAVAGTPAHTVPSPDPDAHTQTACLALRCSAASTRHRIPLRTCAPRP